MQYADPSGREVEGVTLRLFTCWDCGFESLRGHEQLSLEVLCAARSNHSSIGVLPGVVCLSLIVKRRWGPGPLGAAAPWTHRNGHLSDERTYEVGHKTLTTRRGCRNFRVCETSDIRREVDENRPLLGYNAACSVSSLQTFRDNLSVHLQRSRISSWRVQSDSMSRVQYTFLDLESWFLTPAVRTDRFYQNLGKELKLHTA